MEAIDSPLTKSDLSLQTEEQEVMIIVARFLKGLETRQYGKFLKCSPNNRGALRIIHLMHLIAMYFVISNPILIQNPLNSLDLE